MDLKVRERGESKREREALNKERMKRKSTRERLKKRE